MGKGKQTLATLLFVLLDCLQIVKDLFRGGDKRDDSLQLEAKLGRLGNIEEKKCLGFFGKTFAKCFTCQCADEGNGNY